MGTRMRLRLILFLSACQIINSGLAGSEAHSDVMVDNNKNLIMSLYLVHSGPDLDMVETKNIDQLVVKSVTLFAVKGLPAIL